MMRDYVLSKERFGRSNQSYRDIVASIIQRDLGLVDNKRFMRFLIDIALNTFEASNPLRSKVNLEKERIRFDMDWQTN
jgi:hypothetical protein